MTGDVGSVRRAASRSSRSNRSALQAMPYLITSYRPARYSRRGSVRSNSGVGDDEPRRVEGADQVLAGREVHADLAADGRVHLRQQRGRHLHQADAAQEGRGREARHVADDAAADGHDDRSAIRASARTSAS